jgi:hypothetical protein
LSSGPCKVVKHLEFRFKLSWFTNPDFLPSVEKIWKKHCNAKSALYRIQQKLKILKQYFKGWGFNLQGKLKKKRRVISEELVDLENEEENSGLSATKLLRKKNLIKENLQLLDQEETYWCNRCHEQWLLQGDSNTSYFHRIANGRQRKML